MRKLADDCPQCKSRYTLRHMYMEKNTPYESERCLSCGNIFGNRRKLTGKDAEMVRSMNRAATVFENNWKKGKR